MMCDVLKSSKRGIRFPFKTSTPLSLLQILALKEANNILIMKQIKQLPLCPLSGFTSPAPPDNQQQFLMLMSS